MITIEKARDIKSGETVLDRGTRFIIKEVCGSPEPGRLAFIDIEGRWHGNYHPDEYLGAIDRIELAAIPDAYARETIVERRPPNEN